jgi:HPt (histidine-containing phosphotransfer) domain-containing protein
MTEHAYDAPLDLNNLAMLKDLIGDELKPILRGFETQIPLLMRQIEQALEEREAADLILHAHTLKGSSANVGARPLADVAAQLEQAGKNQDWHQADALLTRTKVEAEKARVASEAFIAQF